MLGGRPIGVRLFSVRNHHRPASGHISPHPLSAQVRRLTSSEVDILPSVEDCPLRRGLSAEDIASPEKEDPTSRRYPDAGAT